MRRRLIVIMVAGAVLMIGLWFTELWGPEKHSYASAKESLTKLESDRDELQAKVAELSKLNETKLQKGVDALDAAIPNNADLDSFFHNVQDAASSTGVTLTAVTPASPNAQVAVVSTGISPPPAGVSAINVTVSISGNYASTSSFLDALDNLPRLVITDSIAMNYDGSSGGLQSQLAVRIFTTKTLVTTTTVAATTTTR
jgi:Tfp pilus assembly protein PilO